MKRNSPTILAPLVVGGVFLAFRWWQSARFWRAEFDAGLVTDAERAALLRRSVEAQSRVAAGVAAAALCGVLAFRWMGGAR